MATLEHAVKQQFFAIARYDSRNGIVSAGLRARDAALDFLFPSHCASCDSPLDHVSNHVLCANCARRINWIGEHRCERCGDLVGDGSGVVSDCPSCRTHPPAYVRRCCAVARYADGPVRDIVLGLKFGGRHHIAKFIGELMAHRIQRTNLLKGSNDYLVVGAPLVKSSFAARGFNQADEIAGIVAAKLKLRMVDRLLKKVRGTAPQATLSHEKRRTNLKDAFKCSPRMSKKFAGRPILLIDDVITTGSTISECARTLNAAGLGEVVAAGFARG